ncbi:MAG: YceI family protein [Bacteroidales bacterium]|nr:YceI family protein [Bacteroidales bacterium]
MKYIFVLLFVLSTFITEAQDLFTVSKSNIEFTSDAPLELIKASSNEVSGALKTIDRTFVFRMAIKSFEGFNSSLQKTHFNENYMESDKYPNAIFVGKIIEEINFKTSGIHEIRAKGSFTCHGIKQERIIKCKLKISPDKINVSSKFTVLLEDHNIKIPTVVSQKIAEEIVVFVNLDLASRK